MSTSTSTPDGLTRGIDLGKKVVYQIYPRSFQDSDGDGIGDLRGIINRLDYLQGLGVDYLWITPFFPSPQYDNGYDVSDYCAVDPRFGSMADVEELIAKARERGIGVMLDMVFNHTSTAHVWFQKALAGNERYQRYYFFVDGTPDEPPTNWVSKFGGSAWAWAPSVGKWYLHLFETHQADLNWENPAVREELKNVIRFWKSKGVSGFRFDVVNLISKPDPADFEDDHEGDGRRFYTDGRHVHEFLRELVEDTGIQDLVTVGEMSSTSIDNCIGYSNPANHQLSMTFSFHHLKVDYRDGDKWKLMDPDIDRLRDLFRDWEEQMTAGGGWNALFWCNHDQPRAVSRFGNDSDPKLWAASAKMLGTCIHLMRGTPYIYEGEELGMTNPHFTSIDEYRDVESVNYYRILQEEGATPGEALHVVEERSRDDGRTPMQWDASKTAGFTAGTPWIGIPANHERINVEAEEADPKSVLAYYKNLVALRHGLDVIADGDVRFVDTKPLDEGAHKLICYRRDLDDAPGGQPGHLFVACSFAGEGAEAEVDGIPGDATVLVSNSGDCHLEGGRLTLPAYGALAVAW